MSETSPARSAPSGPPGERAGWIEVPAARSFEFFPQVTQAIAPVKSGNVDDCVAAIRRKVRRVCPGEAPYGACEARQQARCALDAYLLLVVDAVEEAVGKEFDRPAPGFSGQAGPEMRW